MFFSIVALMGMIYTSFQNGTSPFWLFLFMITMLIIYLPSQSVRAEVFWKWKNQNIIERLWSVIYITLIVVYVVVEVN